MRAQSGLVEYRAKIFKYSMGARNRVGIGLSYRPAGLETGGNDSLKSIPGLHKRLKIPTQCTVYTWSPYLYPDDIWTMDIVPYIFLPQTYYFSAYCQVVPLTSLLISGGEHKKMKAEKGEEEE
jgi:hypothetical protein